MTALAYGKMKEVLPNLKLQSPLLERPKGYTGKLRATHLDGPPSTLELCFS